jgi:hypothetical protein
MNLSTATLLALAAALGGGAVARNVNTPEDRLVRQQELSTLQQAQFQAQLSRDLRDIAERMNQLETRITVMERKLWPGAP